MKKKLYYCTVLSVLSLVLYSCSKDEFNVNDHEGSSWSAQTNNGSYIEKDIIDLTGVDAAKVAQLFNKSESKTKSLSTKNIKNTFPINNTQGKTLAYIINFEEGGYNIISATKKYTPIIAFSDEGYIDIKNVQDKNLEAFSYWIGLLSEDISQSVQVLTEDSIRYINYRSQWSEYEEDKTDEATRTWLTRASGMRDHTYWFLELRSKLMADGGCISFEYGEYFDRMYKANATGYIEYGLEELVYLRRSQINITYRNDVCVPPAFFWSEGAQKAKSNEIEPLLETAWGQGKPYNNYNFPMTTSPDGSKKQPIGCVPVAIAQIMNFHKFPEFVMGVPIDWYKTDEYMASDSNTEIPKLMKVINIGAKTKNKDTGSGTYNKDAKRFLKDQQYSVTVHNKNIQNITRDELQSYRPVYMTGRRPNADAGHAWVCDGYFEVNYYSAITAYLVSNPNKSDYPYAKDCYREMGKSSSTPTTSQSYYHMNWGWGYYQGSEHFEANGWYTSLSNTGYVDFEIFTIKK